VPKRDNCTECNLHPIQAGWIGAARGTTGRGAARHRAVSQSTEYDYDDYDFVDEYCPDDDYDLDDLYLEHHELCDSFELYDSLRR